MEACFSRDPLSANHLVVLRNYSPEQAIIEIAHRIGFLDSLEYQRLSRSVGAEFGTDSNRSGLAQNEVPDWDRTTGRLSFRGRECRMIRVDRATTIVPILDAFQGQDWPAGIENLVDTTIDPQRIHQVVRNLNTNLASISFAVQGQSIAWMPTAS